MLTAPEAVGRLPMGYAKVWGTRALHGPSRIESKHLFLNCGYWLSTPMEHTIETIISAHPFFLDSGATNKRISSGGKAMSLAQEIENATDIDQIDIDGDKGILSIWGWVEDTSKNILYFRICGHANLHSINMDRIVWLIEAGTCPVPRLGFRKRAELNFRD